jgi:peptide/nickel transport system permease protein
MSAEASAGQAVLAGVRSERSLGATVLYQIGKFVRKKPLGAFGAIVLVVLIGMATFAGQITSYGPLEQNTGPALLGPGPEHLFGTDQFGRDVFTRIVYGARISLMVSVGATTMAIIPATTFGMTCAYFRGPFDLIFQRIVDAFQAIPGLILLITIVSILGAGQYNVIFALAIPASITGSRLQRAASMQVTGRDYVLAARSLGATHARIIFRYILPNIMAPIIIVISLGFGGYILAESSLSFLGYGVPPPAPSWGGMLASDGRRYMYVAPHMFIAPAAALSVVVFGVNMFGDAMRDILDPRLRGSN